MAGILFMARTSTPWTLLLVDEFGCGSVTTCWRRFAEWLTRGCSNGSKSCCWTSWASPAGWTGRA
jgi:transposase